MLPPVRYPLPTLVAVAFVTLLLWRGETWTRSLRAALAARVARAVEGPPPPQSDNPQVVAGPIVRRALLLHDDVPVAKLPGGPPVDTIRKRMFVDIYDAWPLQGPPEHYRVGNRRPLGWVQRGDLLPWDTRLVLRGDGSPLPLAAAPGQDLAMITGTSSLPLLAGRGDGLEVAVWQGEAPWSEVARTVELHAAGLPEARWGIWLSRDELLALLRRTLALTTGPAGPSERPRLRLRAILGRLLDDRPIGDADLESARAALPSPALAIGAGTVDAASDRLARINEQWESEASWGGLSFAFIPLDALP
jgi:hypothetical protein